MDYQLAQLNIAKFRLPADDVQNVDFTSNLDRINGLAESQPGFVWRLVEDEDSVAFSDPNLIVNLSVWRDLNSLKTFAYENIEHRRIMQRRREWFVRLEFYQVLWWVKTGHHPSADEAKSRLELLENQGPTEQAFTFTASFQSPTE